MLSVDGMDFRLAMGYSKHFWSYKFKKSGVRYEVGCASKQGIFAGGMGRRSPGFGMMR